MNRLSKGVAALLCACGFVSVAHAQTTTVTAAHIYMSGTPIAAGTVTLTPVSSNGVAIPFAQGGGGLNGPTAFSCTITAGAITGSCVVPDSALTTPANIDYQITILNSGNNQSFTLQSVPGVTGTSWALDQYGPSVQTTPVQTMQIAYGSGAAPSPCNAPSIYIRNFAGGQLYMCVAGAPVLVAGSGVVSVNGHAGTVVLSASDVSADAAGSATAAQAAAIASSLQKAGGTMTGPLVLAADPTTSLQAATKAYVDAHAGTGGGGSGTLNNLSIGNLSPLFTASVSNPTSTPAITFAQSTAAANTVFGNFTGSAAAPTFSAAPVFSAANLTNFPTFNQNTTGNAATATALAATPTLCSTGTAPTGILANGNATGCASISSGGITALTGDVTATGSGSVATTVGKLNGVSLAGLATGLLKNTTSTGVPTIAVAGTDYALPNANTTGSAGSLSAVLNTSAEPAHTGDVTNSAGSLAMTVKGANGTLYSSLATGLLKNTTTTGVPSIAVAGTDYLTPTGSATGLSVASSSVFGVVKCDGTSITCTSGVIAAVSGGSGTVTHTLGALTAGQFMLGNGSADSRVSTHIDDGLTTASTITSTEAIAAPSFIGTGTTPSSVSLPAGTGSIPTLPTNSAGFAAPVTGGTAYLVKLPATITAGVLHAGTPGTVDGVNESALTSSLVSLTADVSGTLPVANGGTGTASPGLVAGNAITVTGTWPNQTVAWVKPDPANLTLTMPTASITTHTCTTTATVTVTGASSTTVFAATFGSDPTAVTGWGPTGGLVLVTWPTTNTLNWAVCNQAAATITSPGAMTINIGVKL